MTRKPLIILCLLLSCAGAAAQNLSDLIISEAMPLCQESVCDSYGQHRAWIEVLNTSQGTVNFAGCFFTDDPSNLTKCLIPKGYASTKLGPRQVVLFYASGDSSLGALHLNFSIAPGSTVYLVSNDGRTVIDSLELPSDLPDGMSASKFALDAKEMQFTELRASAPSPGLLNGKHNQMTRAQMMKETDPHGWTLSLIAVTVVFSALLILFLIYSLSGGFFTGKFKRSRSRSASTPDEPTAAAIALALSLYSPEDEDTAAAIATALHLYLNECVHDVEPGFITIHGNPSSPWSSKTLTLRKKTDKI